MRKARTDLLVSEVAAELKIHPTTIKRWIDEGFFPGEQCAVGAVYTICPHAYNRWLKRLRTIARAHRKKLSR